MSQNSHKFWYDRWIVLKFLLEFQEAVYRGVAIESVLGDDKVWSARVE
jgi:hypothetical protein